MFIAILSLPSAIRPVHRNRVSVEAARFVCCGSIMVLQKPLSVEVVFLGKFLLIAQLPFYGIRTQCPIVIVSLIGYFIEVPNLLALV